MYGQTDGKDAALGNIGENLEDVYKRQVVKIGNASFEDCDKLINIKLFDNITAIGEWCFAGCSLFCRK